jgi:two-component system sensor histidine kinase KdpD
MALTTAVLYGLRQYFDRSLFALLYLLPIGLCTSRWGLGAGVIAALSAFLAINYFFIEPYFTLTVHATSDLIVLVVFLIVAVVMSQLVGRAQLREIESKAKLLEESDRLKSALLSSVSHELRTPLSTIKAAATSLRSGEVTWNSKERASLLGAVEDEADHLNLLVGNLLNMSRIDAGQLKPERKWNVLSEIVGSVLSRLEQASKTHRIDVHIPENLPLVPVDFIQMEQVFTNLIHNSLKYAPAGTVITVAAAAKSDLLDVCVSNEGPRVPSHDLELIFEKFHRITAADQVTGTGLGLSICKGIIEAHAGRIWAENLAAGFAIRFTLPLMMEGKFASQPPAEIEA